jgi:transposase-like protein
MSMQILHCPHCQGTAIVRHGKTRQGQQRYRCREHHCAGRTFLLDYTYPGQSPEVKRQIIDMALNASGIRDTARVLHVSTDTVMKERKQRNLSARFDRAWDLLATTYKRPVALPRKVIALQRISN